MGQNKAAMESMMMEAAQIEQMTATEGWKALKSWCDNTLRLSHDSWLYVDEDNKTAKELKRNARTAHAILNLVENAKSEGKRLWNLWARAEGLIDEVAMDMDNVSPTIED